MFRTVGDAAGVRRALQPIERRVTIDSVLEVPPVRLTTVPGFETAVFPYTTDISVSQSVGPGAVYGPGSVHVAHTAGEFIDVTELRAAVTGYVAIAHELPNTS